MEKLTEQVHSLSVKTRDRIPVAKEGYPFIFFAAFFTLITAILHITVIAFAGLGMTALVLYFFRDPHRIVSADPEDVVAPADGFVVEVKESSYPEQPASPCKKIGIFMTIFDVHVNRAPCPGRILKVCHQPGKFISAQKPSASIQNERNTVILETPKGEKVVLVQVAGLIARRIVFWFEEGDYVQKGDRIGMIRFGSRVDLYVPAGWNIKVSRGQRVKAGETLICKMT
ncbi:MAG: phosphatidylserine decarboxylase family protein [Thermodesulforhabdaceae bacterium]